MTWTFDHQAFDHMTHQWHHQCYDPVQWAACIAACESCDGQWVAVVQVGVSPPWQCPYCGDMAGGPLRGGQGAHDMVDGACCLCGATDPAEACCGR